MRRVEDDSPPAANGAIVSKPSPAKTFFEVLFYVTFAAGMAFGTSSFTLISALFETLSAPWVVAAMVLSGVFCAVVSSSIAELASMYPSAPGVRTYLKVVLPSQLSLGLVYLYLVFMILVAGVESYMFALVSKSVFPALDPLYVVLGLLAFTIVVNLLGFDLPRTLQVLTTLLLILTVIVLATYGMAASDHRNVFDKNSFGDIAKLPGAIGLAVYLYVGYEWTTMLGFRPASYRRAIPLSMPMAIGTNVIAYSVFAIGFAAMIDPSRISGDPIPQVVYFRTLLGHAGVYVALSLSILAIFSTFNAGIMGGSRLIFILTREGNLPAWCAWMSATTGAPIGGIIVLGSLATLCSVVVVTFKLQLLAAVIGSCIVSFVYAAFLWAAIKLRRTQPAMPRPFRNPVPEWIQYAVMVFSPVMGILALFSEPGIQLWAVGGLLLFIAFAFIATQASLARMRTARPRMEGSRVGAD